MSFAERRLINICIPIIFFPIEWLGILFILCILGGIAFVNKFLFSIIQIVFILAGFVMIGYGIYQCVKKKSIAYIIVGIAGGLFFVFGFQYIFESLCLRHTSYAQIKTVMLFFIIAYILCIIYQIIDNLDKPSERAIYSLLFVSVIVISLVTVTVIGIKGNYKANYDYYLENGGDKAVVMNDSSLYHEIDYMIGSTLCFSLYPLDLHLPFGTVKKGTTVYVINGKEYEECEVVTEDGRAGYIDSSNIKYH